MRTMVIGVAVLMGVSASAGAADGGARDYGPWIDAYLARKSKTEPQDSTYVGSLMRPAVAFVFCVSNKARDLQEAEAGIQEDGRAREGRWWNTTLDACEQHWPEARQLALNLYEGDTVRAKAYLDGVLASSRLIVFDHLPH